MGELRIFFTTDLHGSDKCFKKFISASQFYKASVIIVGGDITGKMIVPIIEKNGAYISKYQGVERVMKSEKEVVEFESIVGDSGGYPYRTNEEEMRKIAADDAYKDQLFKKLILQRVEEWLTLAEERLKGKGVECFIMPGNDDIFDIDQAFAKAGVVENPEGKVIELPMGYQLLSSGFSNLTPWRCPRDLPEEELQARLNDITSGVRDFKKCIFNLHCPPYDTVLDEAPKLDKDLKPVLGLGGTPIMVHVGSVSVRSLIEKNAPLLSLHGHIHESRGAIRLGKTLSINPGSEYGEGVLRGAIINLKDDSVKGYLLTSG
ncbi:MAG: metallophosphoesterase [Nitrososphaerales archaeon]